MVRAGHALYGYVSPARGEAPPQLLDVKPALTWKAKLMAVKEIPEGALVGYGGSFRASKPMRIGILGAGYADGIFHRLSNRGRAIADGKLTPIIGDDLDEAQLLSISAIPRRSSTGDDVTLLGVEGDAAQPWMPSKSPKWLGLFLTTFYAVSAPGFAASMFKKREI